MDSDEKTVPMVHEAGPAYAAAPAPLRYRVHLEADEDGVVVACIPALPGCVSQGATRDEAIENVAEAARGYLESLAEHGDPMPPPIDEAVVEVRP
jgi:antitoxin HicB